MRLSSLATLHTMKLAIPITIALMAPMIVLPVARTASPDGVKTKVDISTVKKLETPQMASYELKQTVPITPQDYVRQELSKLGRPGDFGYIDFIFSRESGWCVHKWEGDIGFWGMESVQLREWGSLFGADIQPPQPQRWRGHGLRALGQ